MAIAYEIDEDSRTILEVWQGETSSTDWIRHVKCVLEDPDLPSAPKWLAVMRDGRLQPGTRLTDVGALAILLRASEGRIRGGRCAILGGGGLFRAPPLHRGHPRISPDRHYLLRLARRLHLARA